MPIFDYRCTQGHVHEHFLHPRDTDTPTTECPECHQASYRIFTPATGRLLSWEESNGKFIENLTVLGDKCEPGPTPYISSPGQHKKAMRAAGVREATASDWDKMKLRDRARKKTGRWV